MVRDLQIMTVGSSMQKSMNDILQVSCLDALCLCEYRSGLSV